MKWLIAIAVTLVILFGAGVRINSSFNDRQVTCTVVDKDRTSGEGGSMRIYTDECGNLVVADSILRGQWDSSDIYRDIEVGQTYEFTVIGYRVPILSWFPNIIEVK